MRVVRRTLVLVIVALLVAAAPAHAGGSVPANWQRGADVVAWQPDEYASADASLRALAATGSTDAAFVPTWTMASSRSNSVFRSPQTPTDASLLHAMSVARGLGLSVTLKPHVDPPDGYRGAIGPSDPVAWFASYSAMIDHYADLARQGGARMLVIGTELQSLSWRYGPQWNALIAGVRARFAGTLTYASNRIHEAQAVCFWPALDLIGVDAYDPLWSDPTTQPTVADLVTAWSARGYLGELAALSARYARPVIFTEVGYQSRQGNAVTPWNTSGPVSLDAQRIAYEAVYEALSPQPWFRGLFWWGWRATGANATDGDFDPQGKPAASVIASWPAAPPSYPATAEAVPAPQPAPAPPPRPLAAAPRAPLHAAGRAAKRARTACRRGRRCKPHRSRVAKHRRHPSRRRHR